MNQRGMTLVEVMIATAILALVMVSVVLVASHTQRSSTHLLNKTHARWVINNLDAEIRAGLHGKITPTGSFQGKVALGQNHWYWQAKASALSDQVIELVITVQENETAPVILSMTTAVRGKK